IQLQLQFIASGRFVERLQGLPLFIEGNIPAGNCIRPLRKWNQLEQRAAGAWHKFLIQLMIGTGRRILKKHRGSPRSFFKVAVAALLKKFELVLEHPEKLSFIDSHWTPPASNGLSVYSCGLSV